MDYVKTIIFKPIECPYCASQRTFIRSKVIISNEPVRYHRCKSCGQSFRSIEEWRRW